MRWSEPGICRVCSPARPQDVLNETFESPEADGDRKSMPIRITLSDNEVIEVDVTLDDWNRAYREALAANTMLEIEEPDGRILSINPHNVIKLEAMESGAQGSSLGLDLRQAQPA